MPRSVSAGLLASAGLGSEILLWEVATGARAGTLLQHAEAVVALTFSPDGRRLVSLGADPSEAVVVW